MTLFRGIQNKLKSNSILQALCLVFIVMLGFMLLYSKPAYALQKLFFDADNGWIATANKTFRVWLNASNQIEYKNLDTIHTGSSNYDNIRETNATTANTVTATGMYSTDADEVIGVTSTSVAKSIYLPNAVLYSGKRVTVCDFSGAAGTNAISLYTTVSGQQINGTQSYTASQLTISANNGTRTVRSDGTEWYGN